jgi:predicted dehydrogenase
MVEKPMAATLEQADRMLTAAQRHQTCLMVNWPTAWSRPLHTAHRLVGEGAIGQLWQLTWRGGHCGPDELGCSDEFCGFLFDPQLNGAGAFNDYSGYGTSLCVHFLGRPHSVVAMAGRLLKTHLPVDDNGIMVLRYPQALCRLEMTWTEAVPHVPSHDVVLYGTEGTLVVGDRVTVYTRQNRMGEEVDLDELSASERSAATHFLHCIRSGESPHGTTNATQSRHAQEIMEAGLQAATSGIEVSLPIEGHLFRA